MQKRPGIFSTREAKGRDYRIVVLDGEVMSAYERLPLQVQGDGKSTIIQLLDKKQKYFNAIDRDTIIKKDDIRITGRLNRLELTRQNILPKGKVIALLDNRNLSSGGDAVDATNDIHPSFARLCISITRDMGLRYCGVDLMIDGDIRDPVKQYRIIEINAAPGIDHYAHTGRKQKIIVNKMYEKVFLALIKNSSYPAIRDIIAGLFISFIMISLKLSIFSRPCFIKRPYSFIFTSHPIHWLVPFIFDKKGR